MPMCVTLLTNPATSEGRQSGEGLVLALSYGIDLMDYKRKEKKILILAARCTLFKHLQSTLNLKWSSSSKRTRD